eukprot:CAMPEP_0174854600 /NCGR_PEP_ID=MMETSP1114-20130205/31771_1 /TAXON_ID=312471 /ORGANISM="Neobodo designis, Strain CCAP 1951/1" /LENGTH=334 /DNA_ID=CAMNT_0016089303 /DNA_START=77 /DNA_END=1081 /DNA_ORIENTATION=+
MRTAIYVLAAVVVSLAVGSVAARSPPFVPGGRFCQLVKDTLGRPQPLPDKCGVAIVSGGSFVNLTDHMRHAKGVYGVIRGYAGGYEHDKTSYAAVCTGKTGHAEAVMVAYDAARTTYRRLIDRWLDGHNATIDGAYLGPPEGILNNDTSNVTYYCGSQYRSAAFVRRNLERDVFTRALRARMLRTGVHLISKGHRFDGFFQPELESAEALHAVRKRVPLSASQKDLRAKRHDEFRLILALDLVAEAKSAAEEGPLEEIYGSAGSDGTTPAAEIVQPQDPDGDADVATTTTTTAAPARAAVAVAEPDDEEARKPVPPPPTTARATKAATGSEDDD